MSKSEQKRICVQSKCAVRDELREQLDIKQSKIDKLNKIVSRMKHLLVACQPVGCTDSGEAWYKEKWTVLEDLAKLKSRTKGW